MPVSIAAVRVSQYGPRITAAASLHEFLGAESRAPGQYGFHVPRELHGAFEVQSGQSVVASGVSTSLLLATEGRAR